MLAAKGNGVRSIDNFTSALYDHDDALPLMWELFASVRGSVLQQLFSSVADELRAEGVRLDGPYADRESAESAAHRLQGMPSE